MKIRRTENKAALCGGLHVSAVLVSAMYILLLLLVSGCRFSDDDSSDSRPVIPSGAVSIYDFSSSVLTVSQTGMKGKKLYLAKTNPTSSVISASDTAYVASSSGLTSDISLSSASAALSVCTTAESADQNGDFLELDTAELNGTKVVHSMSSARSAGSETGTGSDLAVGTVKQFYLESSLVTSATLRAKGSYCYVWIVDGYYTEASPDGNKVNTDVAQTFATRFDSVYPLIRNVYGCESDELLTGYDDSTKTFTSSPMVSLSDTGTKVNIIVYDIGNDGAGGTVYGIYRYRDYYSRSLAGDYTSAASSNQGKYFYIDSYYANTIFKKIICTLAHEFQHMIGFNVKYMQQGITASKAYKEMLSMLCEDLVQNKLGNSDMETAKIRLPFFNQYYYLFGTSQCNNDNVSYACTYTFGAWLARQFGGAALVQSMAHDGYEGTDSMVHAVNSINGTSYTMADLLKLYVQSFLYQENAGLNKSAAQTLSCNSYTYPMAAINLWDSQYDWVNTTFTASDITNAVSANGEYIGPAIMTNAYRCQLAPYGVSVHALGTAASDTVTLTLSSGCSTRQNLYVLVQ